MHGRRPDVEARVDRFAEALVARGRDAAVDEIVIVGHSMGSTLAVEVVARALEIDPKLGRHGPAVCLLTIGSTIPKFALHPAGERFRRHAAQIAAEPSIAWAEYQARSDLISFYKFDPVKLARFYGDPRRGKPLMRRVWIQDMLTPRTYWRIRLKFMRMHHQFVMANERRSTYDYFMMVCGPISFTRSTVAPTGPVEDRVGWRPHRSACLAGFGTFFSQRVERKERLTVQISDISAALLRIDARVDPRESPE